MVDKSMIILLIVSTAICFLIPLGSLIYFARLKNNNIRPFLIGMLVFFVSQILIRIPIISYILPNSTWYLKLSTNPYLYGIFLGLTAGIFEEVGRYLGFKYLLKKNHRWIDGISYGFGHGGIEAILITGASLFSTLICSLIINSGGNLPSGIYNQITALGGMEVILSGIERISAMIIHIGLSLIVLYGIRAKKLIYLGIAILIHTIVNAPLVILPAVFNVGILGIELYILMCALVLLLFIFKSKKLYKKEEKTYEKN
ncbi:Predicted membrane protein [[Clostridium] sordellii]|uniref:YhfC family intramembrane metalloprotease n=1 Tax=Paraclostridium sordellii TaxID=1505 RepID=UPI0005E0A9F5|nr:YhfC family glutamic-type intramembrane protease [Paeniclostridium sordellii]MDU1455417.1 YhfC family glutamic-type intramembrane protease [Paeniclostridium sordellii]CEO05754.1 Predicted membrane protein [[Clostridium] sordellii] [Paeniclostridium sordellii]